MADTNESQSQGRVESSLTKNCDLFVSGPELAIASIPRLLNFSVDRISSANGLPQMDWPPFPLPPGSPV